MNSYDKSSVYNEYIINAREYIKNHEYTEGKKELIKAISEDIENPIAYNLLGVIYEYLMDKSRAIKFYRVSYYFDQLYEPANNNIERMSQFWDYKKRQVDLGEGSR
jgi:Tfp pilus assembly protein PilF